MLNNHDNKKKLHTRGGYRLNVRVFAALMAAMLALTTLGASLPEESQTAQTSSTAGESLSENKEQTGAENSQKASEGKSEKSEETQNSDGKNAYTYSAEAGALKVTAKAKAGVLPKNVSLAVTPVENNSASSNSNISYEDIENKVRANLAEGRTLSGLLAYDISFFENGQRKEPNGAVELHFSWDKAGAPENAEQDDKVRLLHFAGSDSDLANATVDDLTDSKKTDNTAAVSVNNENKLTGADATVGSFSVFAFAWEGTEKNGEAEDSDTASKDNAETSETDANGSATVSEATNDKKSLAAASQNSVSGNEASGNAANQSDTSDISANKNISDESAVSGNTTGENTVSESGASETAGTDEQSQTAESGIKKQNDTKDQSAAKAEKTGKEKTEKLTGEDSNHKYTVTVSYDKTAKIPAGTSLKVKELSENSQSYKDAKTKTLKSLTDAQNSEKEKLGFAALDISLVDAEGREIEPKADVKVEIRLNELPDGVSDGTELTVKHITDEKRETFAEKVSEGIHSFISGEVEGVKTVGKPVTVKNETVPVVGGQVSGFSVFTITWITTKAADTGDQNYRIGSVTVRYVDQNGLNLDTQQEFTPEEKEQWSQNENGIIDLSEWANNTDGTSRVKGYTFDHATLRSRDGQVITGLKAVKENSTLKTRTGYDETTGQYTYQDVDATVYRLYYTTDQTVNKKDASANTWTEFTDYGTDTYANNSFVYLVYKKIEKPVTVHFLDTSGNAIKDSDGNDLTKVIDAAEHTSEYDLVTFAKANVPNGYGFSDSNMNSDNAGTNKIIVGDNKNGSVTIGSVKGTYERYLKYEDGSVKFRRGNTSLQAVSDPVNIYITFTGNGVNLNDPTQVTIHHVDQYGAKLATDTTDTFGFTKSNGSSNISVFTDRWNGSSEKSDTHISYFQQKAVSNIGTYQKAYIGTFNNEDNLGDRGLFYKKDSSTGAWHTGTGAMSDGGANVTKEITVDGQSGLYTDVYDVYSGKKGLTIHYVDEDGNEIRTTGANAADNGATFNPASSPASINGYTYKDAHIGSSDGQLFTTITFNKASDDTWTSTVKNGDEEVPVNPNPVNEVWLVYTKGVNSKEITLHYQYLNNSGSYSDAYYGNNADNKTVTINVTSGARKYLVTNPTDGFYVENIKDGSVYRPAGDGESEPQPLQFMSSHLAGANGPTVASVDLTSDGTLIYHTSMSGTADPDDNSANPVSWTFSEPSGEQKGRSVSIRKDSNGYLYLIDSLTGDIPLNLVNDEVDGGSADSHIGETYKGTLQNATTDVDYVVTVDYFDRTDSDGTVTRIPRYGIEVTNSYPSTSTDVYQVYIDGKSSVDKIWIEDDMKYTGLFRLDASEGLKEKLNEADDKNAVVEWHRLTVSDTNKDKIPKDITSNREMPPDVTDEIVYRKISGEHWNLALNANERTWLDIEADEGDDVWRKGTTHAYYAKVTYTPKGSSQTQTLYTTPLTVNYYGQLENGSFEDPVVSEHTTTDYKKGFYGGQTSNEWYESAGGVWQTTGPGSTRTGEAAHGQNYTGRDIEIVDATNHNDLKNNYHWQATTDESAKSNTESWAADGNQFAELNAENAGALYQDVITHPNEKINYWLSHRARGNGDADSRNYHYDTMYVVIMPTKLAMTMGDNGTELKTQDELEKFISAHGGFDSEVIKASNDGSREEATMTYYDEDAGIMIYKIRSDENGWHNVAINNQYTAKGGLTRFFFAAASTAADKGRGEQTPSVAIDPPTMGNFIDNVGFNQSLPPTTGFNLTVTETFSGITMEQLAGLASNAKSFDGQNGINAQNTPLQVTLTNTRTSYVSSGTPSNDALNGAKLGFSMSYDNDGNLVLTPTATAGDGTTDLFGSSVNKPGSSEIRQYPDGRIVITWKFPDQLLSESNHSTLNETYNYVANDNLSSNVSTTDINGFAKTTSSNAVDNNKKENESSGNTGRISSAITTKADKTLNIINVYSPNVHISVRKTFEGVTPSTVNEMMNGTGNSKDKPYSITITKTTDPSAVKILKADGGYLADGTTKDSSVSVSSSTGSDGSTTYKWTITDQNWQDGTYTVKEENYTTDRNSLADITLNGQKVITNNNKQWPSTEQNVTVDENSAKDTENTKVVNIQPTESGATEENKGVIDLKSLNGNLPDTSMNSSPSTNLVVGQYTLIGTQSGESANEAASAGSKRYIVWTLDDVGLTTRRAIVNYINSIWGETGESNKATTANTSFYSGSNVYLVSDGRIARMVHQQSASLSGEKWDKFYAGHISAGSNSSFIDESEIRLENEYTPKIKIQKQSSAATVDANGNEVHERLNDAEFRIYKLDTNKKTKLYYQKNGSDQWKNDTDNAKVFTTADDSTTTQNLGSGIALLDSLPINGSVTYYLEETKAPAGYKRISDISFKVRANGTVGLVDENGNDSQIRNDKVEIVFNDPYYTIVVNDDPGIALPNTGGHGTLLFYLAGGLILAMAGILFARTKMKQRAGERS